MEKIRKEVKELQELTGELSTKLGEVKDELRSQCVSANETAERLSENVNQCKTDIVQSNGELRNTIVGMLDGISDQLDEQNEKYKDLESKFSSFKIQTEERHASTETDCMKLQGEIDKMRKELDGINNKLQEDAQESQRQKEQLEELKNKLNHIQIDNQLEKELDAYPSNSGKSVQQVPEWILRERKRNNIIIFGLREADDDKSLIKSLFDDLDIHFEITDQHCNFRIGSPGSGKARPIVVKLGHASLKHEILRNARKLKGMTQWTGVIITHDLTKQECQEEKFYEMRLRQYAEKMNQNLPTGEKQSKIWKVIGGRGERRVKCFKQYCCSPSNVGATECFSELRLPA